MTLPTPRTPREFFDQARRLSRARRHRDLLAYADHYGAEFFGRFTPDERNRLEGIFESAHTIVDLQERAAEHEPTNGLAAAEHPAPAAAVGGR